MNLPFFHAHAWETVGTHYAAPIFQPNPEVGQPITSDQQAMVYGVTRIYQKCSSCGSIQETEVLGHYKAQGVEETV